MIVDRTFRSFTDCVLALRELWMRSGVYRHLWIGGLEDPGALIEDLLDHELRGPQTCVLDFEGPVGEVRERGILVRVDGRPRGLGCRIAAVRAPSEALFVVGAKNHEKRVLSLEAGDVVVFETRPGIYWGFEGREPDGVRTWLCLSEKLPTGPLSWWTGALPTGVTTTT